MILSTCALFKPKERGTYLGSKFRNLRASESNIKASNTAFILPSRTLSCQISNFKFGSVLELLGPDCFAIGQADEIEDDLFAVGKTVGLVGGGDFDSLVEVCDRAGPISYQIYI